MSRWNPLRILERIASAMRPRPKLDELAAKNLSGDTLVAGSTEKPAPDLKKPLPDLPRHEEPAYVKVVSATWHRPKLIELGTNNRSKETLVPETASLLAPDKARPNSAYNKGTKESRADYEVALLKREVAQTLGDKEQTRLNLTRDSSDPIKLEMARYTTDKGLDRLRPELQNRGLRERSRDGRGR